MPQSEESRKDVPARYSGPSGRNCSGDIQGERELFLRLARRRLGEPETMTLEKVQVASQATIEQWADRLLPEERPRVPRVPTRREGCLDVGVNRHPH